jgi:hypothetical protein
MEEIGSLSDTILEYLTNVPLLLQKLIEGEIDMTVTSRGKWLAYCRCRKQKLKAPFESKSH